MPWATPWVAAYSLLKWSSFTWHLYVLSENLFLGRPPRVLSCTTLCTTLADTLSAKPSLFSKDYMGISDSLATKLYTLKRRIWVDTSGHSLSVCPPFALGIAQVIGASAFGGFRGNPQFQQSFDRRLRMAPWRIPPRRVLRRKESGTELPVAVPGFFLEPPQSRRAKTPFRWRMLEP